MSDGSGADGQRSGVDPFVDRETQSAQRPTQHSQGGRDLAERRRPTDEGGAEHEQGKEKGEAAPRAVIPSCRG